MLDENSSRDEIYTAVVENNRLNEFFNLKNENLKDKEFVKSLLRGNGTLLKYLNNDFVNYTDIY